MLNNNDKKYILKRVIVFLIISFISYFMFSGCVKASTISNIVPSNYQIITISNGSLNGTVDYSASNSTQNVFNGAGQGYINFSVVQAGMYPSYPLQYVEILVSNSNSATTTDIYTCDIGTFSAYRDTTEQYIVYSVKCPVYIPSGKQLNRIWFHRLNSESNMTLYMSDIITFTSDIDTSNNIINSNNANAQEQVQAIQQQSGAIQSNITNNTQNIISNIQSQQQQQHQDSVVIQNSLNSNDSDATSQSCGIICKLKYIVNFLSPSNLIHLVVPTQQDWQDVFNNAINTMRNKMGVIGLVMSIFFNFFSVLIGTYSPNYCMQWQDLNIPYFNEWAVASQFTLIPAGQFCIDTYFQDGIYKTFHDTFIVIVGGLIVFAFINYIHKCYKRLLDIPITADDEYEYITESSWQSAHVDYNGNNDYEDFGRSNRRTYRKKV